MLFKLILCATLCCAVRSQSMGTIEVTIATASLGSNANAFADVCIQNDATTTVALPFRDRTLCSCQTKTVTNSSIPVWQTVCSSPTMRYVVGSRVVVEVFNQTTSTTNTFLGGITIGIQAMINNGDNGKQITLPISGGTGTGNLILKVVWTAVTVVPTVTYGNIDVQLLSAEIATPVNAFSDVCLQNGTDTTAVSFPVKTRTLCGCQTTTMNNTVHPIWQQACTSPKTNKWLNTTRITVEVWDQLSASTTNFIGGAAVNITQLLANGDNNKEIQLALAGGSQSGKIWTKIIWTPV
jgi:Ca2+-dependent lipid-binding protein